MTASNPIARALPVICVGNFTAGGTGKTPLVVHLCERLHDGRPAPDRAHARLWRAACRPALGRAATTAPATSATRPCCWRARPPRWSPATAPSGARAIEARSHAADVIVMDDGLQNPQLAKDLTIAVIDGGRGLGNGRVIPAGPLRAPLEFQLGLTDAIVVNEAAPAAGDERGRLAAAPLRWAGAARRHRRGRRRWLAEGRSASSPGPASARRALLCDAGGAGRRSRSETVDLSRPPASRARPMRSGCSDLRTGSTAMLVSTEKDLARLQGATGALAELAGATRALPVKLHFAEPDAERLGALIDSALKGHKGRVANSE